MRSKRDRNGTQIHEYSMRTMSSKLRKGANSLLSRWIVQVGNLSSKAVYRLLLRENLNCKNLTIVSFHFQASSRRCYELISKELPYSNRELSTVLWSELCLYFKVNWAINYHTILRLKSNRFRPFGLFRKSTHSSIGEEIHTFEEKI